MQVRRSYSDKLAGFIAYFKQYLLILLVANKSLYGEAIQNKIFFVSLPVVLIMLFYSFLYEGKETLDPKIFNAETTL